MVGTGPMPLEEGLRNELMSLPGFVEALTPEGIRRSAWLLFGDLVAIDQEPARQWVALDQTERRAADLTPDWCAGCAGGAEADRGAAGPHAAPPPALRD